MVMWLVAAVVFFIIEAVIPGLISLWFGIAAALTMIFSPFIKNTAYEFYLFIILSAVIFLFTRNISKTWREKRADKVDRIRGTIVQIRGINDKGQYDVYLDGKNWIGKSKDSLEVGEEAEVLDIEGIKLVLKKIDKEKI